MMLFKLVILNLCWYKSELTFRLFPHFSRLNIDLYNHIFNHGLLKNCVFHSYYKEFLHLFVLFYISFKKNIDQLGKYLTMNDFESHRMIYIFDRNNYIGNNHATETWNITFNNS